MRQKRSKKRSKLFPFIVILLIGGLIIVWMMVNNPQGMVPDRSNSQAEGLAAREDMLYLLLAGSDQNGAELGSSRADTIIVAAIDMTTQEVFFLSIPRDSYVSIPGYGNDKINHAYAFGGIDLLAETVEDLLNHPIDHYALIDFGGFEEIVDALGGVEIDVDKRMYYQTYDALIDIEAGLQTLDGEEALQYVRYRADALGDITRVSRQQTLLKAIFTKFSEEKGYWDIPQLIPIINEVVETDLSIIDILRLIVLAKDIDANDLESSTLPGDFMTLDGISYWQVSDSQTAQMLANYF